MAFRVSSLVITLLALCVGVCERAAVCRVCWGVCMPTLAWSGFYPFSTYSCMFYPELILRCVTDAFGSRPVLFFLSDRNMS